MERLILLTGKGGVGKTSLAAAHAVRSASQGRRTLLASLDAAHNLSDLLGCSPAPEPLEVVPNLDICEVDANRVRTGDFPDISRSLTKMLSGDDPATSGEIVDVPGLDPLFFLLKVHQLSRSGRYDRVILDLAPTGETLSLLQLPELMRWWMERIFPLERIALRALRPVAKGLWAIELPDQRAMNDVEALYEQLVEIQTQLKDPCITSVRLVTQPEQMVVEETRRAYAHLNLFGYAVDHVYVNGVYPAGEVDDFFRSWVEHQERHLATIETTFPHVPVTRIARLPSDLSGIEDVGRLADVALDPDAFAIRDDIVRETFRREGDDYVLSLPLPLIDPNEVALTLTASDLVVRHGNVQRNIPLPDTLRAYDVAGARSVDDFLLVTFRRTREESA